MKRDVSESLILPHGLINRKQAGGCEGFSIIITLKEMKTLQTLLLRGGSSPCELTLILSGATTSSATKSMWNRWIVWPRVQYCFIYWLYITALLEDCINKQYKCVLHYPHKSHYFFLSYYVVIRVHADNLHLFLFFIQSIYCILWRKAQFNDQRHSSNSPNTVEHLLHTSWFCMHQYGTNIMLVMVSKQWWLRLNVISFFFLQCK